jgi:hypothetical protein
VGYKSGGCQFIFTNLDGSLPDVRLSLNVGERTAQNVNREGNVIGAHDKRLDGRILEPRCPMVFYGFGAVSGAREKQAREVS